MGAEQHLQSLEKWTLNRFLRIIPVSSEHFAPTPLDSGEPKRCGSEPRIPADRCIQQQQHTFVPYHKWLNTFVFNAGPVRRKGGFGPFATARIPQFGIRAENRDFPLPLNRS